MSLILRQAKGSKLTIEEMDGNLTYLEQISTSNSGGNYEQTIGSKTTILSGETGTVVGLEITVGEGPVMITVSGDANPITGTGSWAQLQLYRDEEPLGNAIQAESSSMNENVPFALSIIDEPGAGGYTYTLRVIGCAGSDFEFGEVNGPVIYAVELKQGVFFEGGNIVVNSTNSNAKGGNDNRIYDQTNSTILGGEENCLVNNGSWNSIIGGCCNEIRETDGSVIVGGQDNCIGYCADYSGILAGRCNCMEGYDTYYNGIVGGTRNRIAYSSNSAIIAGCRNCVYDSSNYSVITGGERNCVYNSEYSSIIAGCYNYLSQSDYSSILDGKYNCVENSTNSSIIAGCSNRVLNSNYSSIVGSTDNSVESSCKSGIFSGTSNHICCSSERSTIIGGSQELISNYSCRSNITGGFRNHITDNSCNSNIIGGCNNCLTNSCNSVIIGGRNMYLNGKGDTALFCCIGTNYDGSNYFGINCQNVTISGTNLCIRNGLIVGVS